MADIYKDNLIFEISANNPTGNTVQFVNESFKSKDYPGFPILSASEGMANKYIVPDKACHIPIVTFNKRATSIDGITVIFGIRTAPTVNTTDLTSFMFDFATTGWSGYYFFNTTAKRIAMRYSTTNLTPQTDYNFQPSTDYHIVYQFKQKNHLVYINGVLIASGVTTDGNTIPLDDIVRLFTNPRYGSTPNYSSRFYYMYVFDKADATATVPPDTYFLTPGFKERTVPIIATETIPLVSMELPSKIEKVNEKKFTYIIEGQVTFNSVVKYKHPSTTFVQLIDVVNQTVLDTTSTTIDGTFTLRRDDIPRSAQVLAVDMSGEYNTQILQIKL